MFSVPVKTIITIIALTSLFSLSACSEIHSKSPTAEVLVKVSANQLPVLDVYKSPTCKCCEKWLEHVEQQGFMSKAHNHDNLSAFKSDKGIAPQYRSCHTAVSIEGYVFEGHVPAKFIHQFLTKPPTNAIGLSVPAMPIGTPGMEIGDKFMPYQVILLKTDGSYSTYAEVNSYQEQF